MDSSWSRTYDFRERKTESDCFLEFDLQVFVSLFQIAETFFVGKQFVTIEADFLFPTTISLSSASHCFTLNLPLSRAYLVVFIQNDRGKKLGIGGRCQNDRGKKLGIGGRCHWQPERQILASASQPRPGRIGLDSSASPATVTAGQRHHDLDIESKSLTFKRLGRATIGYTSPQGYLHDKVYTCHGVIVVCTLLYLLLGA